MKIEVAEPPVVICKTCGREYEHTDSTPRWDEDRVVLEFGWLAGHCPECGADSTDPTAPHPSMLNRAPKPPEVSE
jgi:hypothetical protein